MCPDPPNQATMCAKIFVVDPGYSKDLREALLTLPAFVLPFVCATKESAALVLLPVSAMKVVVGVNVGLAGGGEGGDGAPLPPPPQLTRTRTSKVTLIAWGDRAARMVKPQRLALTSCWVGPTIV